MCKKVMSQKDGAKKVTLVKVIYVCGCVCVLKVQHIIHLGQVLTLIWQNFKKYFSILKLKYCHKILFFFLTFFLCFQTRAKVDVCIPTHGMPICKIFSLKFLSLKLREGKDFLYIF